MSCDVIGHVMALEAFGCRVQSSTGDQPHEGQTRHYFYCIYDYIRISNHLNFCSNSVAVSSPTDAKQDKTTSAIVMFVSDVLRFRSRR